ncbi:Protein NRT1/ PTR FAMILY 5.8 [Linum grandiflorum]
MPPQQTMLPPHRVVGFETVIAGVERFAFKGVASNLVTYLTDVVKMSNSSAAKTVNNWIGFTSMLPLLVASLADSYWGRSSTILASCFLYVLGLGALTSTALTWGASSSSTMSYSFLFGSLCVISLGQGGYNPSLQAFGAEQLDDSDDELPCTKLDNNDNNKSTLKTLFFQWWYFGVCAGSLMGVMVMSYIQDTVGWVLGFAIPTLSMIASMVLFCLGSNIYRYKQNQDCISGMPFLSIVRVFKDAANKVKLCRMVALGSVKPDGAELELQEQALCSGDKYNNGVKTVDMDEKCPGNGTDFVQNVKTVMGLLPIWGMLLPFAVIFQQPATFFTKQGMTMERSIGTKFMIPPATLQSSITISIILLMPLYDKILIPMSRFVTRSEKGISVMQRMGIGMFLSVIAMIIAALVEEKRLEMCRGNQKDSSNTSNVQMKIFWLLPQYILLGISDIFTVVGMQEFFYGEVPVKLRTLGIALYTSVFGVGSFMSAMLICLVEVFASWRKEKSWFSDDMREARLDKYYWLLAILSSVSLLLYFILCKFYRSKSDYEQVGQDDDGGGGP